MAIIVNVEYNGGLLPDIILLTQCYFHRGTRLNAMSAQPTPLRESLGRSNQSGSKTSQAWYGHPRCNLNLVRLFRFSLPLPVFRRLFLFPRPRGPILYLQLPSHTVLDQTQGSSAVVLQFPVMRNTRQSFATQSVHSFSSHGRRFFRVFQFSRHVPLDNLWPPMRSSAPDHNTSNSVRWRASL